MSGAEPMADRPHLMMLNDIPWDSSFWVDRHYLACELAIRGWPITYGGGPLSIWQRHEAAWKHAPLLGRFEERVLDNGATIELDRPGKLVADYRRLRPWHRIVEKTYAHRLTRRRRRKHAEKSVAYLCGHRFLPYLDLLAADRTVLHVNDAWWQFSGWTDADQLALEELVRRVDGVVAVAETMARGLPGSGAEKAIVVPHGVLAEDYLAGPDLPVPSDIADIPRPRIGYIGRVSRKVDLGIVEQVARRRPDWHWVLVGRVGVGFDDEGDGWDELARCEALPNVHFLGPRDQGEMPAYMGHMDVNTLIYKIRGGFWEALNPLKKYEYLAVGKPIIGTPIENVRSMAELVTICETTDEWLSAIDQALTADDEEAVQARRRAALSNSWATRGDQLDDWLLELTA